MEYSKALAAYSTRYPKTKKFLSHGATAGLVISLAGLLTPTNTVSLAALVISITSATLHIALMWWTGRDLTRARILLDVLKETLEQK